MNTFFPLALSHFAMILQVVVFPLVHVTPTIVIPLEGKRYNAFAAIARKKW